jgi:NADH dehydrogenase (ubiquinone) Fe-S protein 4
VYDSNDDEMALRRSFPSLGRALLTPAPAPARTRYAAAADALGEFKPGEIGMVSGIPEEHLRRKVTRCIPFLYYI